MSRDTTTGLEFEKRVSIKHDGIDLTKYKLYTYLQSCGIDYKNIISKKLLPDEAYLDNDKLYIYEKKFQKTAGSADEKPQTCGFKIHQFRKIASALGIKPENVSYTYIFNSWFKRPEYEDMLSYIRSIDGCNYIFEEELNGN